MKRSICIALGAGILAVGQAAGAAMLVDFESGYTLSGGSQPTFTNGLVGQQAWSNSTSSTNGNVFTTITSGEYVGGKAVRGDTASIGGFTYIGGKAQTGLVSANAFTYDVQFSSAEAGVGGWVDTAPIGTFANAEAQFMPGIVIITANTPQFGIRSAGFGSRLTSGVAGVIGNWYRITTSIVYGGAGNSTVTMHVRNLTAGVDVDFSVAPGQQDYVQTLTPAQFGANPTSYTGIAMRTTQVSAIDNIASGPATVVPEPGVLGLAAAGATALLARRRRGC